jgi:hypothetical protein
MLVGCARSFGNLLQCELELLAYFADAVVHCPYNSTQLPRQRYNRVLGSKTNRALQI